ncbi:efflux RND transporter periplasmic adaptor subunit [Chlamydiales bacterium]|nr:efflux RND transporter periplasmic adaptor subunit [Chlamydiales bacterium]
MKNSINLLIIVFIFGCQREQPPKKETTPRVMAIQLEDPTSIRSRPFPGVTRAEDRVNLSFRVDGPLIDLPIVVGDEIKKGDLLARIDPRDFEIELLTKEAELKKAEADFTFAESDFARAKRIQEGDPGAISESMVDRKREEMNRLSAEVMRLEAQVEGAEDQLSYTYLTAPFNGIITAKYVDNFQFVRAKEKITRMLDRERIEMVVDIPERIIPFVPHIKKTIVTIDSFPQVEFEAEIKEIGTEASATTRTYPITLVMDQPKNAVILSGMSGEAKFTGDFKDHLKMLKILVPVSAVFTNDKTKKSFLWVIDKDTMELEKREVILGHINTNDIEIESGVKSDEWIVTKGVLSLKEGQKVEIMK